MGLYVLTTTATLSDHVIETAEKHQQKAAHEGKKLKMDQTITKIIQYLKKLRLKYTIVLNIYHLNFNKHVCLFSTPNFENLSI